MLRRTGFFPLILLLLSGCMLAIAPREPTGEIWPSGPNAVSLLSGAVIVDAPDGFCLETRPPDPKEATRSLFFAACGPGYPHVILSAVTSAQATPGILDEAGAETLARYFESDKGRQTLSRSGKAENVTLHETLIGDHAIVMHLSDTSRTPKADLAPTYWRAVAEVNGHLVTFAVLPFTDYDLPDDVAHDLLDRFVAASQDASAPEETKS